MCGQACNSREGKHLNLDQYLSLREERRAQHPHIWESKTEVPGEKRVYEEEAERGGGDVEMRDVDSSEL